MIPPNTVLNSIALRFPLCYIGNMARLRRPTSPPPGTIDVSEDLLAWPYDDSEADQEAADAAYDAVLELRKRKKAAGLPVSGPTERIT